MLLSQFPSTFHQTQMGCPVSWHSHADWDGLPDHLRDVPREDIFKMGASAAASQLL